MDQKQDPIRTKAIRKLIILVAFTAIMLIMSTYAWFSTQKNVTLSGLYGNVNVAEGLQISLDALNWKNEIDLSESGIAQYFEATNETLGTNYDLTNPYAGRTNVTPIELLPVSTTAQSGERIGLQRLNMYRGENTDGIVLSDIKLLNEDAEAGYYAIDFYLQNSSSTTAVANNIQDLIKLEPTSVVTVNAGKGSTGLQNTLRVGFALFDNAGGTANDVLVSETPSQSQILNATRTQNITDVAIWEPNASGAEESTGEGASKVVTRYASHVDYIVQNNNNIKWNVADAKTYLNQTIAEPKVIRYEANTGIPTYALTRASATAVNIANIYDWATPSAGLEKQVTLQTPNTGVGNDPIQLKSVTGSDFAIAPGEYHKLRMYVWLEGQDVDCINYASLGGGLTIEVGLRKGDGGSIETIPTTTSYVGYYADIDGDTEPDGVIYADLAESVSGQWSDSDGTFSYEAITGTKDYYVSKTNHEGDFGTKDVLTATGSGADRFYVMALDDFNEETYYSWYDAAYDSGISDYATVTSTGFGTGKTNTATMIEKWNNSEYGTQNDNGTYADMWGAIQEEVAEGWFVPSKEEWSAFAYNLGITSSDYVNNNLSDYCWSSSLGDNYDAWSAIFRNGYMRNDCIDDNYCVRLSATF